MNISIILIDEYSSLRFHVVIKNRMKSNSISLPFKYEDNRNNISKFYLIQNELSLIIKSKRLVMFKETIAVYCENHMESINTLFGKNSNLFLTFKQLEPLMTYISVVRRTMFRLVS
jgi:hypothetical protein